VRDKDGVAAATVFLRLATEVYSRGQTILHLLEELYQMYVTLETTVDRRYGYFASRNSYVICEDPRLMTAAFDKLRHYTSQRSYITSFGKTRITRIKDISLGYDSKVDDKVPEDKSLSPSSEMISFELEDGTIMTLRGSGTEPKLKNYIESKGTSMLEAESKAEAVEKKLLSVFQDLGLTL